MRWMSWSQLSRRERFLVLAVLCAALLALFFLWIRIVERQGLTLAGLQSVQRAAEMSATKQNRVPAQSSSGRTIDSVSDARTFLLESTTRHGITLSRLQAGDAGQLTFEFDDAEPSLLFSWLDEAERKAGLAPSQARLDAREDGRVRAVFTFSVTDNAN